MTAYYTGHEVNWKRQKLVQDMTVWPVTFAR